MHNPGGQRMTGSDEATAGAQEIPRRSRALIPPALDPQPLDPSADPLGNEPRERGRSAVRSGLTPDGRLKAGPLAGLGLGTAIWVLSWPILVESVLNSLVGLTDTILAAGLDDGGAGADAIGGASYLLWFIGLVVMAVGIGATALVSRAMGAGRKAVARAVFGQALVLAVGCGVVTGGLVAALTPLLPHVLNMSPAASAGFRTFLLINALGVPFTAVMFCGIACLRGAGDSRRPLLAMVIVNIFNMIVSWSLAGVDLRTTRLVDGVPINVVLLHNPFEFHLGITGIAIGTATAQAVGAAVVLVMMRRGVSGVNLMARRLRPHAHTIMRVGRLAWPNFLEMFGMWIGNFATILMVGWMAGAAGGLLGAHIVTIRIEAFSFLPGFAMGTAAATLAGQYLGAGDAALARRAVLVCMAVAVAQMGVAGTALVLWPRAITGLITGQEAHLHVVPTLLMITGSVQIPFAVSIVIRSALRGAGDVKAAMWLTWITTYGTRLPLAYALSGVEIPLPGGGVIPNPFPRWFENGLVGMWVGLCAEVVVRAVVFSARFASGAWSRLRV